LKKNYFHFQFVACVFSVFHAHVANNIIWISEICERNSLKMLHGLV